MCSGMGLRTVTNFFLRCSRRVKDWCRRIGNRKSGEIRMDLQSTTISIKFYKCTLPTYKPTRKSYKKASKMDQSILNGVQGRRGLLTTKIRVVYWDRNVVTFRTPVVFPERVKETLV